MSNDNVSPEDQSAINEVARRVMQQLAAGRSAEEVARELHLNGWQKSTADALVEHVQQDWRQIEAAPLANAGLYLQMKYPEMRPIGSVPSLFSMHGIGTAFYGSRDPDRPTGSYVKTQCFCVLFIPLFALKSYRVTSRGSGWNLIGRVPLSRFARTWNIFFPVVVLASLGLGTLFNYLDSPSYLAGRKLAQADAAAAAGKLLEASRMYREVADGHSEYSASGPRTCAKLVERPELDSMSPQELAQFVPVVKRFAGPEGEKGLFQAGIAWVEHHPQAAPGEVFDLLDQLAEIPGADRARIAAIRRPMLEKLVAADPHNVELTVQLALALEEDTQAGDGKKNGGDDPSTRIFKLLSPLRKKLGDGEGARLLGQALAAQGKFDESYALLSPYLDKRLDAFHDAERAFEGAIEQAQNRIVNQLQQETAPGFDFKRANLVSEKERQAMAREYISRHINDDPGVDAAREKLEKQGMVVPAALDLGMVTLQRAQSMQDSADRHAALEQAEKTFRAIRGTAASETDQFELYFGQVCYWLGKQKEGQDQFDKLLAKHQRKAEMLYSLANVLRDLGATVEARKLLEEAYEKSTEAKVRQSIAHLRAIASTDLDDEIHWLELCDASDVNVKALLAESRGESGGNRGQRR